MVVVVVVVAVAVVVVVFVVVVVVVVLVAVTLVVVVEVLVVSVVVVVMVAGGVVIRQLVTKETESSMALFRDSAPPLSGKLSATRGTLRVPDTSAASMSVSTAVLVSPG